LATDLLQAHSSDKLIEARTGTDRIKLRLHDDPQTILDLPANGLASIICCAAGYRAPDDKYATLKKARFPREQAIHIV
jgi:hypothetical protein